MIKSFSYRETDVVRIYIIPFILNIHQLLMNIKSQLINAKNKTMEA